MQYAPFLFRVTVALLLVITCWTELIPNKPKKTKYPLNVYQMYKERLLSLKAPKVSGAWSPWSEWSPCSRSCGGGITQQTRHCVSKPLPTMKERYAHKHRRHSQEKKLMNHCVGLYKRIHLCNTQDCPFATEFRSEQCAAFNNRPFKGKFYRWQSYIKDNDECALNCVAVGGGFYATLNRTVVDGTSCPHPNSATGKPAAAGTRGVCVDGYCKALRDPQPASRKIRSGPGHVESKNLEAIKLKTVAFTGVIGAIDELPEECAACAKGNCRSISGLYTRPDLPSGYSLIAQIPQGACRILVQQLKPTRNIIALRTANGSYVLNGDWKFSNSRIAEGAGTHFTYRKQDGSSLETVTSPGPLAAPVDIMLVFYQLNPGIKYGYSIPNDAVPDQIAPPLVKQPNDVGLEPRRLDVNLNSLNQKDEAKPLHPHRRLRTRRRFAWKINGVTACSKSCGGGIQAAVLTCVREHSQTPVLERRCVNIEKPMPHPIRCNLHKCPTSGTWDGHWGPCTGSCGYGEQEYIVQCVQKAHGRTVSLNENECPEPKPYAKQSCGLPPCENTIDNELPRRPEHDSKKIYHDWSVGAWSQCSVSCGAGHRSRQITCPSGFCRSEDRPAHSEHCENDPCSPSGQPSDWLLTEWSQCSEGCGTGNQTRLSVCAKDSCEADTKPETVRACSSDRQCGGKWFAGPWSQCSDSCLGPAKETRDVHCIIKLRGQSRITTEMTCPANKPETERSCRGGCPPNWYVGEWGPCEGSCPSGLQRREARCLHPNGQTSTSCNVEEMPLVKKACTCLRREDSTVAHDEPSDRNCVDRIRNCYFAVQARLCQYHYYMTHCCVACKRSHQDPLE